MGGRNGQSQVHLALHVIRKTSPAHSAEAVDLGRLPIVVKRPILCNVLIVASLWWVFGHFTC